LGSEKNKNGKKRYYSMTLVTPDVVCNIELNHKYYTVEEASAAIKLRPGAIYEYCSRGRINGAYKFRGKWLLSAKGLEAFVRGDNGIAYPLNKLGKAEKKLGFIKRFIESKNKLKRHHGCGEADRLASEAIGVPLRTIQRWLSLYDRLGIAGLIDTRGPQKINN